MRSSSMMGFLIPADRSRLGYEVNEEVRAAHHPTMGDGVHLEMQEPIDGDMANAFDFAVRHRVGRLGVEKYSPSQCVSRCLA